MTILRRTQSLCMFAACLLMLSSANAENSSFFFPGSVAPGRLHDEMVPINRIKQPLEVRYGVFPTHAMASGFKPFVLRHVHISGNDACCGSFMADHLIGKRVTQQDITHLADCIARYYREHGNPFALVEIPRQSFGSGELELVVHVGVVSEVDVRSCSPAIQCALDCYASRLKRLSPATCANIERVLMIANQMAGVTIKAEVVPDTCHLGGVKVCLTTSFKRFGLDLGYDNYQVDWQGPHEYDGSVYANSLLQIGDHTAVDVVSSVDSSELQYAGIFYDSPLGLSGLRLHAWFNYAQNRPQFTLTPLSLKGDAYVGGLLVKYPFIFTMPVSLYGYLGARVTESELTSFGNEIAHENLRVVFLGAQLDQFFWEGNLHGYATLSEGFGLIGGSQPVPFGDESFTKIDGELNYEHYIIDNFKFYVGGYGQYGFKPLSFSEQIGLGGRIWGRAYDWAEILGDSGVIGTVELRYDTKPCTFYCNNAQWFIGYDAGVAWLHDDDFSNSRSALSSVQGGVRLIFKDYLSGDFVLAKPLSRVVESQILSGQDGYNTRAFFRIVAHL